MVFVWRAGRTNTNTYLGMFDINAWYDAQMPMVYEGEEVCSYLTFSELEGAGTKSGSVMDVAVTRDTVSKYGGGGGGGETCYPSSLAYDLLVLTDRGVLRAGHLGLQGAALAEIAGQQAALVQPAELYQLVVAAGMMPDHQAGGAVTTSTTDMREALLTVALEHNMVGVVVAAARDWADGR